MDVRVISIGALDAHDLRSEPVGTRTGHATTTLIRSKGRTLLIDPGLPHPVLAQRLAERAGLTTQDLTHVFLTSFRPDTRRALPELDHTRWWISEAEREAVGVALVEQLRRADDAADAELAGLLAGEIELLRRCEPAPDQLADRVDLFPLPGVTPGLAGALVAAPRHTTLICGDAIPTAEHLDAGRVPRFASDADQAKRSVVDALEVADLLVLGRDNILVNPTKTPF